MITNKEIALAVVKAGMWAMTQERRQECIDSLTSGDEMGVEHLIDECVAAAGVMMQAVELDSFHEKLGSITGERIVSEYGIDWLREAVVK